MAKFWVRCGTEKVEFITYSKARLMSVFSALISIYLTFPGGPEQGPSVEGLNAPTKSALGNRHTTLYSDLESEIH